MSHQSAGTSLGIVNQIPVDPPTLFKDFNLEPNIATYLCCRSCHALYLYNSSMKYDHDSTPKSCVRRPAASELSCDYPLWEERHVGGQIAMTPWLKYIHLDLKEWLGRLLARLGIEDILQKANRASPKENMADIHDSPFWHTFPSPDDLPFMTTS
ncbi:hypothetical protein EDD18DRAFT_1061816, partial [Armillaria luteobubalina]